MQNLQVTAEDLVYESWAVDKSYECKFSATNRWNYIS